MFDRLKKFKDMTIDSVSGLATRVGDLNGDGKLDEEDVRIAKQWATNKATTIGEEATKLGRDAIRSDLAKDAASGAAVGAVVAVPIPLVGPAFGAVIGAGLGVYKNITKSGALTHAKQTVPTDIHLEIMKLADLREKNLITEIEFETQKRKILNP